MPTAARRWLPILAAAVATSVGLASCATGSDAVDQQAGGAYRFVAGDGTNTVIAESDRQAAPEIAGPLIGGGQFDPDSLDGKVTLINFWGSWCAPCRVETPELESTYEATKDSGVAFLGVNVKDSEQLASAFLDEKSVTYPNIYDPDGRIVLRFRDYPPSAIPSTIVLDATGRVAAVFLKPLTEAEIRPVLTALAGEG